jgi:prevent-host-death family protein
LKAAVALAKLAKMKYVNTHEAKTQLSKLIAAARAGEEIVICQAGKPVARLTAFEPARKIPRLGTFEGLVELRPGWDSEETDAEIEALMLGEDREDP